jgi:hypothetical protein
VFLEQQHEYYSLLAVVTVLVNVLANRYYEMFLNALLRLETTLCLSGIMETKASLVVKF